MSPRLYSLLGKLFAYFRNWHPGIGFRSSSVGLSCGGASAEFEELEIQIDIAAMKVLETGWDELNIAERTCVEMALGIQPWVWTARVGVMEAAIEKLEKKLRTIGC